jgi:elongation factor 1-gamma
MAHTIHTYPNNPRVWKALIANEFVGAPIKYTVVEVKMGEANKTPAFLAKNPLGKVPVLETPQGSIFESNAIARYAARQGKNNIYGANAYEASLVDMWIEFANHEIQLPSDAWLYPIWGYAPNHPAATAKAKEDVKKLLKILNDHFLNHTYLVGERVSLADIIVALTLYALYTNVLDANFRKPFPNVTRWFQTILNQPQSVAVIGSQVKLCDVAKEPAAGGAQAAAGGKKEAKKEEKPKKDEKPKAEKKPKKEEEDEEEDDTPKEEKPKSILDTLPPSKLNLDEWKRTYSNNDTKTVAMPWLFQNFDPEGYSIWFAEYKYPEELSKQKMFQAANAITGFLQRLDRVRKYGFGCVLLFGEEGNMNISSAWIFRGQEVPQEMKEVDDYDLYNWSRANLDNDKEKLIEYFSWEGNFGGRGKPKEGKTFK